MRLAAIEEPAAAAPPVATSDRAANDYNFEHFRTRHLLSDLAGTLAGRGIRPGATAPGFELPRASGGRQRLRDLRDRPVALHFGSFTWPVTIGSEEPMKQLYARWGDQVHFVDVVIRQAHPGPGAPPYQSFAQKLADAQRYQREEGIPWLVLVDDLEGTVHEAYGGLADPTYLIDREGRVAFYNLWTYGPALHAAIEALLAQQGRGVVNGGIYRTPQLLPAVTEGWRGIERGLPQSYVDLELAAPGAGAATWLGRWFRPLLRPLVRRAQPLSPAARIGLAAGALALGGLGLRRLRRR